MRRLSVALLAALALSACGKTPAKEEVAPAPASSGVGRPGYVPSPSPGMLGPLVVVQLLYDRDAIPTTEKDIAATFSRDLAMALMTDQSSPETQAVGADYRYDAQDTEITDFVLQPVADGPEGSVVLARFNNFGKPVEVNYLLCRRPSGEFRIKDVAGPSGGLRAMLKLPEAEVVKEC